MDRNGKRLTISLSRVRGIGWCFLSLAAGLIASAQSIYFNLDSYEPRCQIRETLSRGGHAMAAGDVDGDGYHDAILFLSGWRFNDHLSDPIKLFDDSILIQYGGRDKRGNIDHDVYPGQPGQDETLLAEFDHDGENPTEYINAASDFSKLGIMIACEDFDKDGIDDIVFSANDLDPQIYRTDLCIMYGNASMRGEVVRIEDPLDCPDLTRFVLDDPNYGEVLSTWPGDGSESIFPWESSSLCTGDFNGDTYPDIAITLYRNRLAPEVLIIFGRDGLRRTTRALSIAGEVTTAKIICESRRPDYISQDHQIYGPLAVLTSGDINGDGIDDLAIGDPWADPDGIDIDVGATTESDFGKPMAGTGTVFIVYGSRTLPDSTIDLTTPSPESGQTVIRGESYPNMLGGTLYFGDTNQDGYDDLAIGAMSNRNAPSSQTGASLYLFLGASTMLGTTWGNGSVVDLSPSFAPPGHWGETRMGWFLGSSSSRGSRPVFGDVSGDGRDDLIEYTGVLGTDPGDFYGLRAVAIPSITPGQRPFPAGLLESNSLPSYMEIEGGPENRRISAQHDFDGDGEIDFANFGYWTSRLAILFGDVGAPTAKACERFADGKTALRGFGGRLSPVIRAHVGFEDGVGGSATVTLNKTNVGLTNIFGDFISPIDCYWHVTSDRTSFTQANLLFRYIDDDLTGLPEDSLVLINAPAPNGPWARVSDQQLNTFGNRVSAHVSRLGYFAIAYDASLTNGDGPRVKNIKCDSCRQDAEIPGEDVMTVTFTRNVTGVDASDFAIASPAGGAGSILELQGSGNIYTVRVELGVGVGPATFTVLDDDSIRDDNDQPLGGAGTGNGSISQATCSVANRPVRVSSIIRKYPSPNALPRVWYAVNFDAPVTGVDASDFQVEVLGLDGVHIDLVEGAGDTWNVWVNTGTGSGTLILNLKDNDSIRDGSDKPLGAQGPGNGDFAGPSYSILREPDTLPPTVRTITRASVNPTSALSVDYYVEFTEDVVNVDVSDFDLIVSSRINGAEITGIHGDALVAVVTISTGTGDGTIKLRLHDDDSITDLAGNPLGGAGAGNGSVLNGPVYSIYKSDPNEIPPSVTSITRLDSSPTDAFTVRYRVRFDENVAGVDAADFVTTVDGMIGSSVTNVSGSGDDYTVTVNTGNGAGTLRLDVRDNDSILDADRNPLGGIGTDNGHFTNGQIYQIVRDEDMSVRSFKNNTNLDRGDKVNVNWTSGDVGKNVRIELWREGRRVAVLVKKTKNDGKQGVVIPGGVATGGGYTIRIVSTADPKQYTEMKKPFTVQ